MACAASSECGAPALRWLVRALIVGVFGIGLLAIAWLVSAGRASADEDRPAVPDLVTPVLAKAEASPLGKAVVQTEKTVHHTVRHTVRTLVEPVREVVHTVVSLPDVIAPPPAPAPVKETPVPTSRVDLPVVQKNHSPQALSRPAPRTATTAVPRAATTSASPVAPVGTASHKLSPVRHRIASRHHRSHQSAATEAPVRKPVPSAPSDGPAAPAVTAGHAGGSGLCPSRTEASRPASRAVLMDRAAPGRALSGNPEPGHQPD